MKNILVLLFVSVLLVGCGSSRVAALMQKGEVSQTNFKEEIPFEMRLGVIIVKVSIAGKEYDFLFDTGAPLIVSEELANHLKAKTKAKGIARDSRGQRVDIKYILLDTLNIGGIDFLNTGAGIIDFSKSNTIKCLGLDGIVGANVMRNAIWQINYETQIITVTNTLDSLRFTGDTIIVPFDTKRTGTPIVDLKMDSSIVKKWVTIDTGSNGNITLNNSTYNKLKDDSLIINHSFGYGNLSSGIFGDGNIDTLDFYKIRSLKFADVQLDSIIVSSSRTSSSSLIGTEFFKNYIVTFNWNTNEMTLDPVKKYERASLIEFGFKPNYTDNKLLVGFIFENSSAHKLGLQLNDQIISIRGKDYTNTNSNDWCDLIFNISENEDTAVQITILRDGETKELTIVKSVILE